LPPHIIHEILLRIPAESLLGFKSVCKDWYSLIKDPSFAKQHYDHHKANNQSIDIVFIYDSDYLNKYYLTILNKMWEYEDVPCNKETKTDKYRVKVPTERISKLTSCNGLLCFHTEFPLLMLNPITKEMLKLPKPWIEEEDEEASACGFGFDAKKNVYKVVQLKRCFSNSSSLECEVLELGTTMSWRKIQHQPSFPHPDLGDPELRPDPVFVEGSIYWIAFDEEILCFDVAAEMFELIPGPDPQTHCDCSYTRFLVELDRNLCLMTHSISCGVVGIWKMQKDCVHKKTTWIKSYSFDTKHIYLKDINIKSLCIRSKKIYLKYREGLACYDTLSQKLMAPVFNGVADNNLDAVAYTKSIVSLQDVVGSSIMRLCTS
ncbi:hypothetical protein MKX03_001172, partial [Papaver bracteatum]